MRVFLTACVFLLMTAPVYSQQPNSGPKSITVPAAIDHNRVVINVDLPLPDGSSQTVRAWVDNGNPDLYMSRHLATLLGLAVTCSEQECTAPPPKELFIGGVTIPLTALKEVKIPLRPVNAASILAPGMNVEINLPSTILRHYDVLVDFPDRKFSIGIPGTLHFHGTPSKVQINAENGLIEVPSQIENKKYNLALDFGSCISFLSEEVFNKMVTAHPDWPEVTGAVGSANMWGAPDEAKWKVMRLDRLQYGPLYLTDVAVVSLPKAMQDFFEKRAGVATIGLLGSNMLLNYRVGLDYAHSTVYFEVGRTFKFPDFDVVGLVLRPEDDGRFTVLGVPEFDGKPAVPSVEAGDHLEAVNDIPIRGWTMGQVWSTLGGTPGQEKRLTIERGGKEFALSAKIQHFLPEIPEDKSGRKK
jgi:hypothetical protein